LCYPVPWWLSHRPKKNDCLPRRATFTHIHKATTPTLFVCGEKDWNVPVQNSKQLYQAMRRLGITAQLVVYPGEHHGGWSTSHSKDYQERRLAWFDTYVKGPASRVSGSISQLPVNKK
jgi:dipeptidyl aminopeptidase/acylaminoacyl peptidase